MSRHTTRQDFSRRGFLAASMTAVACTALKGAPAPASDKIQFTPRGELAERIGWTLKRLEEGKMPAFTDEFILADLALQPPRRFNEYSGDLSGRYIGALASFPGNERTFPRLKILVEKALTLQHADGRFGDPVLNFDARSIGPRHMALLWGNGRLLAGLMEYHQHYPSPQTLEAAKKLGGFLIEVFGQASQPGVRERLAGQGASGFICFTQLIEGLVMLAAATGNSQYLRTAASIYPLLEPRGIQHAHGYLTTLRGAAMLAAAKQDGPLLESLERNYRDLVASYDYTPFGSVQEYFGFNNPQRENSQFKQILADSGNDPRDEGCGHGDFLRLSLQLWQLTAKIDYLERAEFCLENGFLFNQNQNGDFGSKVFFAQGIKPVANIDRAWWCCTLHGFRTFPEILNNALTTRDGRLFLNLFAEGDYAAGPLKLQLRRQGMAADKPGVWRFTLQVLTGSLSAGQLAIRQPGWAGPLQAILNGRSLTLPEKDGNKMISAAIKSGDQIWLDFPLQIRWKHRDGKQLAQLSTNPVEACLLAGPWLMGVDSHRDQFFFGEPWPGNRLLVDQSLNFTTDAISKLPQITFAYIHDGFFEKGKVTLRPVSDGARADNTLLAYWLNYQQS
jgi:hypothetical protein